MTFQARYSFGGIEQMLGPSLCNIIIIYSELPLYIGGTQPGSLQCISMHIYSKTYKND